MPIRKFEDHTPVISASAYVDDSALVIGDVVLGDNVSIWPQCVIRGDIHFIRIGERTNIQDGSILHVTHDSDFNPGGYPLTIGSGNTVGHRVTLHGCTIGDNCLIGMGAIIMDGAVVESKVMIGAGSLVPPGKTLETGHLYVGSPVQKKRPLTDQELAFLDYSANRYATLKERHLAMRELEE